MKKLFLLALLAGSTEALHAQSIAAGTLSLGGNVGYGHTSDKAEYKNGGNTYTSEYVRSQFQFVPAIGYFVANNLAIGVSLGYTAASEKLTNTGPYSSSPNALDARTTLRVGPYVQYYKMISEQFGVLGTLSVGYQHGFTPSYANNGNRVVETTTNGSYAALTPGIIFFPIPKFGISASVGYLGYEQYGVKRNDDIDGESQNVSAIGAAFGLNQLMFGGTYYFGR